MKTIAAITFGCKVNQYETSCILDEFVRYGYEIIDFNQTADVYIINSCTVTNRTDYKSRNAVRKALIQKEKNPDIKVIITGCYSQRNRDEILKLGPVDLIADNNEKSNIFNYIKNNNLPVAKNKAEFDELNTALMVEHTRAFIKVQDGCDYYCAYCAIPYARGTSRSRKKENVLKQIKVLTKNGYREFVLGGINLGLYGREKDENYFLTDLLRDIEKICGVKLIRLSSIEPQLFTDELLEYFTSSKKICHHFHIPLQVGCDELLSKMGRRYNTEQFQNVISKLKQIFPDVAIGIDVIAGLPGETEELFQKTHLFLSNLEFTYLHVFSYSKRPGTRAEKMKGHVNGKIIKERSNKLIAISDAKLAEYTNYIVDYNIELTGIIERRTKGFWTALSDHYVRIFLKSDEKLEKKYLHLSPVSKLFDGVEVELTE